MAQAARKSIPRPIQAIVMLQSRQRCALCFHWHGDLSLKAGHLAHIDRDRTNNAESNLAFLCQPHHDQYDTKPSQTKRVMPEVLVAAKQELQSAIVEGRHASNIPATTSGRETDRQTLNNLIHLMTSSGSIEALRPDIFSGYTLAWPRIESIEKYVVDERPELDFIDPTLEILRNAFKIAWIKFLDYISVHAHTIGEGPVLGVPSELKADNPGRYVQAVKEFQAEAYKVCAAYDDLIRTARRKLAA